MLIKNKEILIKNGGEEFFKERELLLDGIELALKEVSPKKSIFKNVRLSKSLLIVKDKVYNLNQFNHIYLAGFGKASIKMTEALLSLVKIDEGVVVSNVDFNGFNSRIKYIKGGHPIPDEGSIAAGRKVLNLLEKIEEDDLLFVLISGGGSSLLEYPLVSLEDLKETTKLLLSSGASIDEINVIRKHLSLLKGGKLLKRCKGRVVSLIISDVVFDSLDTIASGPTYFDSSTFRDAMDVILKYGLINKIPESVKEIIYKGMDGEVEETLKENDESLNRVDNFLVATNYDLCIELKNYFDKKGINSVYLGSSIQGEAREVAEVFGGIAWEAYHKRLYFKKPLIFILGGETTVTVKGNGKGGRNQELSLAVTPYLSKTKSLFVSFGTDGIDGNSPSGGAICDSNTAKRAESLGLDYRVFLDNNDSFTFFNKLNDTITTGPTGTNVMDVMLLFTL